MRSGARTLAALLVVGATSSYGVVAAEAADVAVEALLPPAGGCWSYAPSAAALDAPPALDHSTELAPWLSSLVGEVRLESSGATVVGGARTASVTITGGPVISDAVDVAGTASFLLSLGDVPLAEPVAVPFEAAAGQPVADLLAQAEVAIPAAGAHSLRLDAVYFDAPSAGLRLACNGQESGTPGGPNPATDPEPTDVTTDFTAVASSSATVTSVSDQDVLDAARPGDVVTLALAGLASAAPTGLQLCSAADACTAAGGVLTEPDGTATATFTVPAGAGAGAGTLRVDDGATRLDVDFTVLGVQRVAAAERLTRDSTVVTLTGTGWDPLRPVTIRGHAGADSSAEVTSDPEIVADVDPAGQFTAEFEVTDLATGTVVVDQARSSAHIGAEYLISGVIGGAGGEAGEDPPAGPDKQPDRPDQAGQPETPSTGGTSAPAGSGTPVAAPASTIPLPAAIPLPGELPVAEPPAPAPSEPTVVEELAVSEVRLDGRATLAELFGGSPRRSLIFLVTNAGETAVADPVVRVAVGRSDDVEPLLVDAEVGDLEPGEQAVVTVPLQLPIAAFGEYRVVGQVGDSEAGAFAVEWTTYPAGLFALNALALVLLGWGVWHRLALRRKAAVALAAPGQEDAVVDLAAADRWWAAKAGRPGPGETQGGEAVIDLAAAEKWWGRSSRAS